MKKSALTNCPLLMTVAFMLFAAPGSGSAATNYVWRDNPAPPAAPPFDTWAKAATNIQLAVDASSSGDTVLVTNGTYDTGGAVTPGYKLTNRVCIAQAITVRSMNGPGLTIIKGAEAPGGGMGTGAVRCVYIGNVAASLSGFTLTNGHTHMYPPDDASFDCSGGGVFFYANGVVSNCVITGNSSGYGGGGAILFYGGTLNNCTIETNVAAANGGGVYVSYGGKVNNCMLAKNTCPNYGGGAFLIGNNVSLNNCMIVSNGGKYGGGAMCYWDVTMNNCTVVGNYITADGIGYGIILQSDATTTGTVNNCIVWGNTYGDIGVFGNAPKVNYTCSNPAQTDYGIGNIGGDPAFVDAAHGNYRLKSGSPCFNTGTNGSWTTTYPSDLDGRARIRYGAVDMGAYEFIHSGTIYAFH